jgi:RNA recognition motif-containing protein
VVRADILTGADNRSKGCGIVEFALAEEAQLAITTLNDTELKGRPIFVREDRETNALGQGAPVAGRRLYVGNLAFGVAWYDLKDFFKACGTVVRADILMGADNRSKGCGIVEFSLPEEAQLAITTLNDTELKGRTIFVREDRELATPAPPRSGYSSTAGGGDVPASTLGTRVFVGNLAWDVGWPQLKDHFKSAGVVAHADVPTDDDGRSRGYGIVEYKQAKDALYAIHTLNGTTLGGRAIKLREYGDN